MSRYIDMVSAFMNGATEFDGARMMRAISDNIVELSFLALIAFFIWGVGYVIMQESKQTAKQTDMMYEACISTDKQWIKGNCVR